MAKAYDLTGQRFGRLVALYKCDFKLNNHYPWMCQCDCGKTKIIRTRDLVSGKTTSCGCYQKEVVSKIGKKTGPMNGAKRKQDIANQRFGKLVALYPTEERDGHSIKWFCQCDCGNTILVSVHQLRTHNTMSCGCLKSRGQEKIANLLKQNNISFVAEKWFNNFYYSDTNGKPRFDFYINDAYLIEYDGIQHFKENPFFQLSLQQQREKDNIKNNWCKENNIPLIRIPYTQLSKLKIEDLLLETSEFIIK